jgi:hypothetical protein
LFAFWSAGEEGEAFVAFAGQPDSFEQFDDVQTGRRGAALDPPGAIRDQAHG